MSNIEKLKKNGGAAVLAQLCNFVIQFINRAVFVHYLNVELLGYISLFGNVFALLSFAELGIETIISVHLYKELSKNNQFEIGRLLFLYKWLYRFVAITVLLGGIICFCFLPYFVKKENVSWNDIYIIYFMQLFSVFIGYFLSYKRTLFVANQEEYKCIKIEVIVKLIIQLLQLVTLIIYHNFFVYLTISLSTAIISNILISYQCNKNFPYILQDYKISKEFFKKINFFGDLKNFAIHKMCYVIYGATDNIIISMFCGIRTVALYSNYAVIQCAVQNILLYQLLKPLQATLGNIVYSNKSKEELWYQFNVLEILHFLLGSYLGTGFIVFSQITIQFWLGAEFLLSDFFVIVLSLHIYLCSVFDNVCKYRNVFGNYKQDRIYMLYAAVFNIIISIFGAKYIGVEGVILGTFISTFSIFYGRIRFVVKYFFLKSIINYLFHHVLLFSVFCLESLLCFYLCSFLSLTPESILIRVLIWITIPSFTNLFIFFRNEKIYKLMYYIKLFLKF